MSSCCDDKSCEITVLRESHGRVLWIVLAINAAMFFVEGAAGLLAHSTSLLADALDMFGDAMVYGFSLFVLSRSAKWQVGAALGKGVFMLVFGVAVLGEAIHKILVPVMPAADAMGMVGAVALAANLLCFFLLYRHRADDINMSSTWTCSRNDLIANVGVLLAAGGSYLAASRWPDIIVGTLIAVLFILSSVTVLRRALAELKRVSLPEPPSASVKTVQLVRRRA